VGSPVTVQIPELVNGEVRFARSVTLPAPGESGIEHIVVAVMENRSFDHFLGWLPGSDGKQAGLTYADAKGQTHQTYPLAPDFRGCGHPVPDNSYDRSRIAYAGGSMTGFLKDPANDEYCIGYYTAKDQPFFASLVGNYLACDHYFAPFLGPTFPNRFFLWAAQTDRLNGSFEPTFLTTIFDRLHKAGVSHRYYFSNVPFLALWGVKYILSTSVLSEFFEHAANGKLPAVSFVDPTFTLLDNRGEANDDHPHSDIRNGESFLSRIVQAVTNGPAARNTVLIITFDEWGGFFDHLAPPRVAAANNVDKDQVEGKVLLGFRVAPVIVSPFTRNNSPRVTSIVFDHTSILKLIEWRWSLAPLTPRDASPEIGNLAAAMNFQSPDYTPPVLAPAPSVRVQPCSAAAKPSTTATTRNLWNGLTTTPQVSKWRSHPKFTSTIPGQQ
jgi:phospholipase C